MASCSSLPETKHIKAGVSEEEKSELTKQLVDGAIATWKELTELRIPSGGIIIPPKLEGLERDNHDLSFSMVAVELLSKQATLPRSAYTNHIQTVHLAPSSGVVLAKNFPRVQDADHQASTFHHDLGLRAVLRQIPSKSADEKPPSVFIEVWNREGLEYCFEMVDGKGAPLHGSTFKMDSLFLGFQFSPDGTMIVYAAESLPPKSCRWDLQGRSETPLPPGRIYEFKDHWGEQLDEACLPRLFIADLVQKSVSPVDGIDPNLCCFDPRWTPTGDGIVFVGLNPSAQNQRRHGLIYCTNRPSALYHASLPALSMTEASPQRFSIAKLTMLSTSSIGGVKSPRFSSAGNMLVYLDSVSLATHNSCNRLLSIQWNNDNKPFPPPVIVLDNVSEPEEVLAGHSMKYPGIYCSHLIDSPWINESELLLSTVYRSQVLILKVDVETHLFEIFDPFLLHHNESTFNDVTNYSVVDVAIPYILFAKTTFASPPVYYLSFLRDDVIAWTSRLTPHQRSPTDTLQVELLRFAPSGSSFSLSPQSQVFEAFLLSSPNKKISKHLSQPLIVIPHGGPHSSFVPYFSVTLMTYALNGFDLLLINYRGSLGFGQNSVESLPGLVGQQDVADVYQVTANIQRKGKYNSLYIHGGSHGGFIAAHMVGQYPDLFNAVCLRNPVTNMSSMISGSDIRDWCFAEACGMDAQTQNIQTRDQVTKMYTCSPIAYSHQIRAPCLIFVGQEDQRVPSYQGIEFHFLLKCKGIPTRLISYSDCHALTKVPHDFDSAINAIEWFSTYGC